MQISAFARFAQIYAVPVSDFVRKTIDRFYGACFGKPSQRARGFGKDVVRDKNIALPACWRCRRVLRKRSPTTWSTRACGSSSTTRKACSTYRAMSPCTRLTPPWNCCTPCTSTSPKVDELGSRRRRMSKRLRLEAGSGFADNQLRS